MLPPERLSGAAPSSTGHFTGRPAVSLGVPFENGRPVLLDQNGSPIPRLADPNAPHDLYGFPLPSTNGTGDQSQPIIPHIELFGMVLNMVSRVYSYRWDEALRCLPQNAVAMRRDCYLKSLIQERKLETVNRSWQIVPEDTTDSEQKERARILTRCIKKTRYLTRFFAYMMEALWFGRYGSQITWVKRPIGNGQDGWCIGSHSPVNGDKIQFDYNGQTPSVFINAGTMSRYPLEFIALTDRVPSLKLVKRSWREQFIIHVNEVDDADYFEGEMAGSVGGVGLRHWIYWCWWMRDEVLSWVMNFMKKAGALGLLLFYYELGNPQAQAQAEQAVQQSNQDTALAIGRPGGKEGAAWGVDHVAINMTGVELLQKFVQEYFEDHMERLIVGQTLSANTEGNGLGGSGVASMHTRTKFNLLKYDANNFGESLTWDLVEPMKFKNFGPDCHEDYYWKFNVDDPENEAKVRTIVSLSQAQPNPVTFKMDQVRALTGMAKPEDEDELFGGLPPATPGVPGGGEPGAGGGEVGPDGQPLSPDEGGGGEETGTGTEEEGDAGAALPSGAGGGGTGSTVFDWQPTATGRGQWSPSTRRWKPLKYADERGINRVMWLYAEPDEAIELYRSPGVQVTDWQPAKSGRGFYSPSTHRWSPTMPGQAGQHEPGQGQPAGTEHPQSNLTPDQHAAKVKGHAQQAAGHVKNALKAASQVFNHPGMDPQDRADFARKAKEHAPILSQLLSGKAVHGKHLHELAEEVSRLRVARGGPREQAMVKQLQKALADATAAHEEHAEASYHAKIPQPVVHPMKGTGEGDTYPLAPAEEPKTKNPATTSKPKRSAAAGTLPARRPASGIAGSGKGGKEPRSSLNPEHVQKAKEAILKNAQKHGWHPTELRDEYDRLVREHAKGGEHDPMAMVAQATNNLLDEKIENAPPPDEGGGTGAGGMFDKGQGKEKNRKLPLPEHWRRDAESVGIDPDHLRQHAEDIVKRNDEANHAMNRLWDTHLTAQWAKSLQQQIRSGKVEDADGANRAGFNLDDKAQEIAADPEFAGILGNAGIFGKNPEEVLFELLANPQGRKPLRSMTKTEALKEAFDELFAAKQAERQPGEDEYEEDGEAEKDFRKSKPSAPAAQNAPGTEIPFRRSPYSSPMINYAGRAAGNFDPGDWKPTSTSKGLYSPSTGRWKPAGSGSARAGAAGATAAPMPAPSGREQQEQLQHNEAHKAAVEKAHEHMAEIHKLGRIGPLTALHKSGKTIAPHQYEAAISAARGESGGLAFEGGEKAKKLREHYKGIAESLETAQQSHEAAAEARGIAGNIEPSTPEESAAKVKNQIHLAEQAGEHASSWDAESAFEGVDDVHTEIMNGRTPDLDAALDKITSSMTEHFNATGEMFDQAGATDEELNQLRDGMKKAGKSIIKAFVPFRKIGNQLKELYDQVDKLDEKEMEADPEPDEPEELTMDDVKDRPELLPGIPPEPEEPEETDDDEANEQAAEDYEKEHKEWEEEIEARLEQENVKRLTAHDQEHGEWENRGQKMKDDRARVEDRIQELTNRFEDAHTKLTDAFNDAEGQIGDAAGELQVAIMERLEKQQRAAKGAGAANEKPQKKKETETGEGQEGKSQATLFAAGSSPAG